MAASPALSLPPGHPDEFVGQAINPAEQIRVLLVRKRRQGIADWERVWPWAVGRIRWPHDREERHAFKAVIAWSEPYFRAAYEGRRDQSSGSMTIVLAMVGVLEPDPQ